jgi:hypothetical protein
MGARNRVGIVLSYRPARLYRLAELISSNRFLGSLRNLKIRAQYYCVQEREDYRVPFRNAGQWRVLDEQNGWSVTEVELAFDQHTSQYFYSPCFVVKIGYTVTTDTGKYRSYTFPEAKFINVQFL